MQLRNSSLNRDAGAYLQRARESLTPKRGRPEFAAELGQALGIELTANTYWSWETGRRLVPGAAIFAAFRLSGLPVADPAAERTLAEELRQLRESVEEIRSGLQKRRGSGRRGGGLSSPVAQST